MIINDASDVEQRAGFIPTNLAHKLVRLFGIGLRTLRIRVKPISCFKRVLQVFFKLIDRANLSCTVSGVTASTLLRKPATNSSFHFSTPPM